MENFLPIDASYSIVELIGEASKDFGQRLFSRNLQKLSAGEGALSVFLSADAKILGFFWAIKQENDLLLLTPEPLQKRLIELIEKYHFAENFTVNEGRRVAGHWSAGVNGPNGFGKATDQGFTGSWRNTTFVFHFHSQLVTKPTDESWERHRILNMLPRWDFDFEEATLVFDVGFEELCDDNKGCYIGQEVVERVRSRGGNVARRLALMEWESSVPALSLVSDEKSQPIGSISKSIVASGDKFLSLGFLKRGIEVENTPLISANGVNGRLLKIYRP